jgi:hypothetical protein
MEQRANVKFCFKTGKTATETFQLIKQAYGDNVLSLVHWLPNGMQDFGTAEDDECSGRPTAARTPDVIERVREFISTDRRMSLWIMEEEVLSRLVQRIRRVKPQFQER